MVHVEGLCGTFHRQIGLVRINNEAIPGTSYFFHIPPFPQPVRFDRDFLKRNRRTPPPLNSIPLQTILGL